MIVSKKLFPLLSGIVIALSVAVAWAAESGSGAAAGGAAGVSPALSNYAYQSATQLSAPVSKAANTGASDGRGEVLPKSQELDAKLELVQNPEQITTKEDAKSKSEFQTFVMQSLGRDLPMFGYDLFRHAPSTFAPVDHIPVTPDYTIGPGDELLVHVWGQVEANQSAVVDRNGQITLPKVGTISVVGVSYQNLQAHLKAAVGKMFRNFELDVTLGKLRSIQVFVVGQAARPGNYTVSSLSTLWLARSGLNI